MAVLQHVYSWTAAQRSSVLRPSGRRTRLYLVAPRSHALVNTESMDDYLKAILELSGTQEQRVTSNALVQQLGVRAASVTGMLQKLAAQKPPFVKYEKHHGVRLTATGKMRALEVLRRHRLLERCLLYTSMWIQRI